MRKKICVIFLLSLALNPLSPISKDESDYIECVAVFSEMAHYFDACLKFHINLNLFSQKYNTDTPEIICKFCPQRSLPCDELIIKVQAKTIEKAIAINDSTVNDIRKKMLSIYDEITQLLEIGTLSEVRIFMAKIAQEEKIACEDCQKVEWQAIGVITPSKKQNVSN